MHSKRVALVHYWLVGMRGGERVLEALCRIFPSADIYTHVYDPSSVSDVISRHQIIGTFIGNLPFARRMYKAYLPLMPLALESLDFSGYDLIISSESGPAKGIIPSPNSMHICYCHSPMRYIWDQYHVYRARSNVVTRYTMPFFASRLRLWDESSSARVDVFVANSSYVARRIQKYYRRDALIIHPPVNTTAFDVAESWDDYYLLAGELVSYKRPDIAIAAFNASGRRLTVIGDGPELHALRRIAKPNITFLGKVDFSTLRYHFSRCRALIFPGIEDFGMVPVEVMASGRPVIALGEGGAEDTVIDGVTGVLYRDSSPTGLNNAIQRFEKSNLSLEATAACVHQASKFSASVFATRFSTLITQDLRAH